MSGDVCVAGAGSWGTVLAMLLATNGFRVHLYCRDTITAERINAERHNPGYHPELYLPTGVIATADIGKALVYSDTAYLVIPGKFLRASIEADAAVWSKWIFDKHGQGQVCICSKGLLIDPVERIDYWLQKRLNLENVVRLSGPNLSSELASGQPSAAVAAAPATEDGQLAARRIQSQLNSSRFRVYTGSDPTAVEVAGFYKNVLAIAAGILHGLGYGANTHAVLLTRGLAELGRLSVHLGGGSSTLLGLAGVGDVIATCQSPLSRNFQTGLRLAAGEPLADISADSSQIAEGIQASLALERWPSELSLLGDPLAENWPELPIAQQVYRVIHEGADPALALSQLMSRPPRAEGQVPPPAAG